MKAVFVSYSDAGSFWLVELKPEDKIQDELSTISNGEGDLIKFENGKFFQAEVTKEEVENEAERDAEPETTTVWSITDWMEIQ